MAEQVQVELEVETKQAEKNVDDLTGGIKNLTKAVEEGNEQTAAGLKSIEETSKTTGEGVKGIGNAIKAAGVGLFLIALESMKELFMQNQQVADAVSGAFEGLALVFNDVFGLLTGGQESVKKLGDAFDKYFGQPIKTATQAFEKFGDAFSKIFGGDFSGALESAKEGFSGLGDAISQTGDGFVEAATDVAEYVVDIKDAAVANVQLAKAAEKAEVINAGLLEKYDRQAEQLRQIRDDESKSFEERIKANDDLGILLDEQEKAMKANAQARVNQAAVELAKNKENIDLQVAYQEALNEQAAIEAQITGFRSEQQTNTNSLLREQKDLQNELALIGKTEREIERTELQQDYDAKKALIEREITDEAIKKEMLLNLERDYNSKIAEIDEEVFQEKLIKAEKERELEKQKIRDKQMVVDAISQFAAAESGIGKALLIAKQALALQETLLDVKRITFKGSQAIGEAGVNAAQNVSESSKIGFPQNIITIATAIAQGVSIIRSVKSAVSKTKAQTSSMASSFMPSVDSPSSTPPAFNVVGTSGANQLAGAIAGQQQQPVKAFVVSNDVTTAQELDRNIVTGATIG